MIERYSTKEMNIIWNEDYKYKIWLKIEILVVEALNVYGIIPEADKKKILTKSIIDKTKFKKLEKKYKHDILAFTRMLGEKLGPEKKWIHFGLTSTDIVDTANSYLISKSNDLLIKQLNKIRNILLHYAKKYKHNLIMGRTHGVNAEPTTVGYKFAIWLVELDRNIERFILARKHIEVAKISGSVGTFANIDPFVEEYVSEKLKLNQSVISNQTLQRDRHAYLFSILALIGSFIEKVCIEIRNLHRTEISEIQEGFSENQKGSSSMPHKKNPIGCENLCGCARVLRGYMISSYEDIALWGERDISHSSVERIIIPDIFCLTHYMLIRFADILINLKLNFNNMEKNIKSDNFSFLSQRIMNMLILKGISRDRSYDIVQELAFASKKQSCSLIDALSWNVDVKKILSTNDIEELKDLKYFYRNIDKVFKKLKIDE